MYEVLFDEYKNEELARIRLTEGKFSGIVYHYNTLKFEEDEDGEETAALTFEYDVVSTPDDLDVDSLTPEDKEEFENTIAEVLNEIITQSIEEQIAREAGNNDTIESDL